MQEGTDDREYPDEYVRAPFIQIAKPFPTRLVRFAGLGVSTSTN